MMDVGWSELLLVAVVAIFAIGPQQLPEMMYKAGRFVRRLQYIRYNMSRQMEDYLQMGDLRDLNDTAPLHDTKNDAKNAVPPPRTGVSEYTPDDEAEADADLPDIMALRADAPESHKSDNDKPETKAE